ncbi:hypothetical protein TGME49_248380 [Toxoplasma gondii ME49]|uniref:Transmembrane protein n=12 Tax=Toxoplasma gondii TaxID=5811 RepID=A0A125YX98_TOXGV|nr:hypothetical protein TGME49_248380 [Toxoplasma gondii ME49]ESS34290.1 putative transmembrane protein [Toxoplasma gondii VEG]KFG46564.1 putative transmembrane protein [Toxoplasma gondii GAB2-2007-GAL-DOM2]KFG48368.1 putative transmembrane protein [Toxoplasma gondii p89]KFG54091.1 putative transmembrane protein [Toxoplasma gondii FOU]KFG64418.1 putative transmembrane protein [Toxoplasma gondii RUB]KFH12200.1 putative transmembrane protein [Toxoplasma gondii VAND]KFH16011.1 putative transmem|eukprot:XP_018634996.1 hypothetical protein TGME49_248380 [Toxoplasma gondii ME49]
MELASDFKARSFLGFLSIRSGLVVIAFVQILTGVSLYLALGYLRPSLHGAAYFMLLTNIASALLGTWGLWRRNQCVETIYLATYLACLSFLVITVLSFANVVQALPKAPAGVSEGFTQLDKLPHFRNPITSYISEADQHAMLIQILQHSTLPELKMPEMEIPSLPKMPGIPNYEDIPFVPHLNQTEGETEELSAGELPPEAQNLTHQQQEEVTALVKMQKRPVKLAFAGVLGLLALFQLYGIWIIITFIMNKCMSFDELAGAPEQFRPLVGQ